MAYNMGVCVTYLQRNAFYFGYIGWLDNIILVYHHWMEVFKWSSTLHSNKYIFTSGCYAGKFLFRMVLSWWQLCIKKRYCYDTWCWSRCQCCNLEQLSIRYFYSLREFKTKNTNFGIRNNQKPLIYVFKAWITIHLRRQNCIFCFSALYTDLLSFFSSVTSWRAPWKKSYPKSMDR